MTMHDPWRRLLLACATLAVQRSCWRLPARRTGDDRERSKGGARARRAAPGSLALHALRELRGLPQQPRRSLRRGRLDRRDLALDDDGELGAGSRTGRRECGARRSTIRCTARRFRTSAPSATCRWPPRLRARRAGRGEVFAHLPIARRDPSALHRLASDGISCTVCHQISSERLGTRESFNGEFVIKPTPPDGARVIFGPYKIDAGRKTIMRSVTGFVQAEGTHITQSELCASCHTLITQAFGPNGEVIGSLPEQMNYQEWQHSDFTREERSCQSCHMPKAPGPVRSASVLGDARDSLSRHLFVGGNAFMVRMFNRYRTELGVEALVRGARGDGQGDDSSAAGGHRDGDRVGAAARRTARLAFDIDVRNLTGHKYPTGYPSRRTWLHVTVRDAKGAALFESGADAGDAGAIAGNDSDADPLEVRAALRGDHARRPGADLRADPRRSQRACRRPGCSPPPNTSRTTGCCRAASTRRRPTRRLASTAKRRATANFAGGGDRVRYTVDGAVRPGRSRWRRSCATSRSGTAGRTISNATTPPSRSGSSATTTPCRPSPRSSSPARASASVRHGREWRVTSRSRLQDEQRCTRHKNDINHDTEIKGRRIRRTLPRRATRCVARSSADPPSGARFRRARQVSGMG